MSNDTPHVSVNLRQTTKPETTTPTLYEKYVDSSTSHRIYYVCKACETAPTVYRPYPRGLENQPFADVMTKAALSTQLFYRP